MIKPDADVVRAFAHVAQNVPRVGAHLEAWYRHELERLPNVARENQALASGRCQVLQEVCSLLADAPSHEAPRRG